MVAVSGGVDSVVLLHLLAQRQVASGQVSELASGRQTRSLANVPTRQLTVAHFDHGIRTDSAQDRKLVQTLARQYGLPFVYQRAELGPGASEAAARQARYEFLHQVRRATKAEAIVTAHHQDDLLETVVLNLLRGTGRRGLSSLRSTDVIKRPLLGVPKNELLRYANREGLRWREDSTNADTRYLRNYVRAKLLPRFASADRGVLVGIAGEAARLNREIAVQTSNYLHLQPGTHVLDRHEFTMLPHAVAREIMAEWLLTNTSVELSRKLLERLVVAAKTGKAGARLDVDAGHWLELSATQLALVARER